MGRRGRNEGSIYRRADGVWTASINLGVVAGRRKRKVLYGRTRAEVAAKVRAEQSELELGLPVGDSQITVAELCKRWLDDDVAGTVAANTELSYRTMVSRHVVPHLGHIKVMKLTPQDVAEFLRAKSAEVIVSRTGRERQLSPRTVQMMRGTLVQALKYGERQGVVRRNVASLARAPKKEQRRGRSLDAAQARHLMGVLVEDPLGPAYALCLSAGLRRGEVLGLTWSNVDLTAGEIHVERAMKREPVREGGRIKYDERGRVVREAVNGSLKTAQSDRVVAIAPRVAGMLAQHRAGQAQARAAAPGWADSDLVFTAGDGRPVNPDYFSKHFKELAAEAGLGDWHLHELRHSAASLLLAAGIQLKTVSDQLGHANIATTADFYTHVLKERRTRVAEAMSGQLWDEGADTVPSGPARSGPVRPLP